MRRRPRHATHQEKKPFVPVFTIVLILGIATLIMADHLGWLKTNNSQDAWALEVWNYRGEASAATLDQWEYQDQSRWNISDVPLSSLNQEMTFSSEQFVFSYEHNRQICYLKNTGHDSLYVASILFNPDDSPDQTYTRIIEPGQKLRLEFAGNYHIGIQGPDSPNADDLYWKLHLTN